MQISYKMPSGDSCRKRRAFEPVGGSDMTDEHDTIGCPYCFTRYVGVPERCETCGYRFRDHAPGDES